jgi:hypothetical protein
MSWNNPYYSPKDFDLEIVAELELTEPDYSFDTVVVWRHTPTGRLYWAWDSGCSCPTPFEDYTSLDKLNVLSSDNYDELKRTVANSYSAGERAAFLRKVRDALRK